MRLALIPAGTFRMGPGQEGEAPAHDVTITQPFYLGVHEVTQQEYQQLMATNPSWFSAKGEGRDQVATQDASRFPVESVSWQDAVKFCEQLSSLSAEKNEKRVYRLPTEAEWEYACRGGATVATPFHFGTTLPNNRANFGERRKQPAPVGSYAANGYGLFDLHGNVAEWCQDWFDRDYYRRSPSTDPPGPSASPEGTRVIRGGSWRSPADSCRTTFRARSTPDRGVFTFGFRVAMTAP
jgi:formylglycine-generating enzyme required for sulfatase activity